jgi:hypothetical protein
MKICQDHWGKLRAAIKERGIDHLVARTGKEAAENMKADLEGRERDYDPLMDCHWMITSRAVEHGGLYLMAPKEDGTEYCPICEALLHKPDDISVEQAEKYWIDGPADAALGLCREKGLVPGAQ